MPDRRYDPYDPYFARYRRARPPQRSAPHQTGADEDRYELGRERRYSPDRNRRTEGHEGGYEGNRAYPAGGYSEEFGYRGGNGPRRSAPASFDSSDPRRTGPYGAFERMGWAHDDAGPRFYGTGVHAGGGFGTAPGSEISAAGTSGAPGYAGQSAWSDRYSEQLAGVGEQRNISGSYESYGRSPYGAQSGHGRGLAGRGEPSFRGRGPKGYARSDERLQEAICERLTDDPLIDASDIEVAVKQQVVTLTGTVEDRRTKWAAEDLAASCGAQDVDNQLRVKSRSWEGSEHE